MRVKQNVVQVQKNTRRVETKVRTFFCWVCEHWSQVRNVRINNPGSKRSTCKHISLLPTTNTLLDTQRQPRPTSLNGQVNTHCPDPPFRFDATVRETVATQNSSFRSKQHRDLFSFQKIFSSPLRPSNTSTQTARQCRRLNFDLFVTNNYFIFKPRQSESTSSTQNRAILFTSKDNVWKALHDGTSHTLQHWARTERPLLTANTTGTGNQQQRQKSWPEFGERIDAHQCPRYVIRAACRCCARGTGWFSCRCPRSAGPAPSAARRSEPSPGSSATPAAAARPTRPEAVPPASWSLANSTW